MQLRFTCATYSIGMLACGSVGNAVDGGPDTTTDTSPVDGAADSPLDTPLDTSGFSPLTITTYRTTGPVNTQLVAFQDGDGPWIVLSGTAGVYTATLQSDRYGVMTSCISSMFGGGPSIIYGAVSDGTTLYWPDCEEPSAASVTISGNVMGAAPANPVVILTPTGTVDLPAGASTYSLMTVAGPAKLIAAELANARPVKLAMVDANVVDSAKVNFDLAAGFAPVTHSLMANASIADASMDFRDIHGIVSPIDRSTAPLDTFRAIPAERLGSGLNRLVVHSTDGPSVVRYFKEPVDQRVTFSVALQLTQQPTATAAPYPNIQFTVPIRADGSDYSFRFATRNAAKRITHSWSANMTSAWVEKARAGATTFAYTMPDFHALSGWHSGFQAEAGLPLDWSVGLTKAKNVDWFPTVAPGVLIDHDGSEFQLTTVFGQLAAP